MRGYSETKERQLLEKQKIELAKLQLAQLEKEIELQTAKNKALSLNPAAKVEEKQFETNIENMIKSIKTLSLPVPTRSENFNLFFQSNVNSFESLCDLLISDKLFETLNKETATHIGIREAEDWFRPVDLAKECDIYISSRSESPLAVETEEKRDRFEQTSRTLERKISMRSSKEELVKKDVLLPDGTDKDQDSKINDSVHPTVLSSSQNHAMPVKHNVFLLNLPDVEEVPSHDGETVQFSRIMIC
ncbi:phosphatase and actin regulator 2 [Trichonephila clavipes]|nr:phosphatase and actin regulator 2 [Trichonephila clavipes]